MRPLASLADVARAMARPDAADALFGPLHGATDEALDALRRSYRRLVVLVHPDVNPGAARLATVTFQQLEGLRAQREREIVERPRAALPGAIVRGSRGSGKARSSGVMPWTPARPSYDYDDTAAPPLPGCLCVELARATLPGRVVFGVRGGVGLGVRVSDHRTVEVNHSAEYEVYRYRFPDTLFAQGFTLQTATMSMHLQGWSWQRAALERQAAADPFAMAWGR